MAEEMSGPGRDWEKEPSGEADRDEDGAGETMPGASWSPGVRGSRNLHGRKRRLKIIRKGRVRREELGNGGRRARRSREAVMWPRHTQHIRPTEKAQNTRPTPPSHSPHTLCTPFYHFVLHMIDTLFFPPKYLFGPDRALKLWHTNS